MGVISSVDKFGVFTFKRLMCQWVWTYIWYGILSLESTLQCYWISVLNLTKIRSSNKNQTNNVHGNSPTNHRFRWFISFIKFHHHDFPEPHTCVRLRHFDGVFIWAIALPKRDSVSRSKQTEIDVERAPLWPIRGPLTGGVGWTVPVAGGVYGTDALALSER